MKELDAREHIQPKDGKKEYLTIEELRTLMATDSYRPEARRLSSSPVLLDCD